jgi:hypothetical protein
MPNWAGLGVIGFALCFVFVALVFVAFALLIVYLGKNVVGPMNLEHLDRIIEDWAEDEGYEVVGIREVRGRDHPFRDRFGWGRRGPVGVVRQVKVRDKDGAVRRGWVFVKARLGPHGYSGFQPGSVEVVWEDEDDRE